GNVYEGRPTDTLGAHTYHYNEGNFGLAFAGCFDDEGCVKEGVKAHHSAQSIRPVPASQVPQGANSQGDQQENQRPITRPADDLFDRVCAQSFGKGLP
ncbi:MAG: hypothetical protein QF619_10750, partial [Candidatus Binatia bacterium]|nr:hypothetical protein [Candidatus Binatia bacterium]